MATYKASVGLSWTGAGSPGVNVWHFRCDDQPLSTSVQEVVDALEAFYTAVKGSLAAGVTVTMPEEVIEDPYGSPTYKAVDGWSVTGSGATGYAPLASAIVIGWRTTSATRSGRGRTFLSPLAGYCVDADGTPKSDVLAQVRGAAQTLVDTSDGWNQAAIGVYSLKQNLLRDIKSSAVRDTFAVLRSRRD